MKWYIRLSILTLLTYSSSLYAAATFDQSKVSPVGQLFADRIIQIYCMRSNGLYNDEYCIDSPRNKKIIDELLQKKRPPFYGLIDLISPSHTSSSNPSVDKYTAWAKTIPKNDLVELTKHPDVHVRTSAFQALIFAYPEIDFVPIIIDHLDDNEGIWRSVYDEVSPREKVGDVFFDIATGSSFFWLQVDKFSTSQREKLLNALLTTPNELDATSDFVLQEELRPEFYSLLRGAVQKSVFDAGFYSLAKYRKPEDIPLILNYLVTGGESSSNTLVQKFTKTFTQEELFSIFEWEGKYISLITDRFRKQVLVKLYDHVTSSLDNEAIYSLSMYLLDTTELSSNQKHIHQELLFHAVMQNNMEDNEQLLWYLWSGESKLNIKVYDYLIQANPKQALDLTKKSLRNIESLYQENKNLGWYHVGRSRRVNVDELVSTMFDFLLEEDSEFALAIIKENLENPDNETYSIVTRKIIETQNKQFIGLLLDILESDEQPIVHHTILTLRSFDDAALNKKIATSLIRNRNTRTSENWKWLYGRLKESGVFSVETKQ